MEAIENSVGAGKFISRFPGVLWVSSKSNDEGWWWVKFSIDVTSRSSWHVIQGLAYVLNNLSLNDPLPTVFFPTSSPPDMNGGPADCLCWVIEPRDNEVDPSEILAALYSTLAFDIETEDGWIGWSVKHSDE